MSDPQDYIDYSAEADLVQSFVKESIDSDAIVELINDDEAVSEAVVSLLAAHADANDKKIKAAYEWLNQMIVESDRYSADFESWCDGLRLEAKTRRAA